MIRRMSCSMLSGNRGHRPGVVVDRLVHDNGRGAMRLLRVLGRFLMTMVTGISVILFVAVVLWAIAAIAMR